MLCRLISFCSLALALCLLLGLRPAAAALPSAEVCEWAAQQAAEESGVPMDILGALTLTETGRRLDGVVRPWAWSANAEGEGTWFDDPASAVAFVLFLCILAITLVQLAVAKRVGAYQ